MRRTLDPELLRRERPSVLSGALAGAVSVAALTCLIYPLEHHAPVASLSVVYVLAVLVVATVWGAMLGVLTALASAAAFNVAHLPPVGNLTIADSRNWVALAAFLIVALAAAAVAELARSRAREADDRRREAGLAAELAQLLLGGTDLSEAVVQASRRLAAAIGASSASIELGAIEAGEGEQVIALNDGDARVGSLVVPGDVSSKRVERVRAHVVPALTSVLVAALARDRLQAEVVETAALRRSDGLKTALLRSVSHDLRTPVTAIRAGVGALRASELTDGDRNDVLEGIDADANRLSRLIEKLLDLSRLQAGTAEPNRTWCSLDEVLHEAVEHVAAPPGTFVFSVDAALPLVRGDAAQLERAFANVLENAARHSAGKPVSVRARTVGERIVVRVVDQGPGIAVREHERIFTPFYRAPDATTEHHGSGLGLAISKGFIESNGGRIWVESLPGQGTSFVIELPLQAVPATTHVAR